MNTLKAWPPPCLEGREGSGDQGKGTASFCLLRGIGRLVGEKMLIGESSNGAI